MAELKHGKPSTYNNHKCRCPECTKAWADYMKPRIKAHRAKKKLEEQQKKKGIKVTLG